MPEQDDLFDNLEDDDQPDQSGEADDAAPAPEQDESDEEGTQSDADPKDKRINDLMKRAQKAEAALAKAKRPPKQTATPQNGEAPRDDEFTQFMRENVREVLFNQNPELKEYGFAADDIAGQTPAEMRASLGRLTKRISSMEAVAVRRAQERLGIDPEIGGGVAGEKLPDFSQMSDEEFAKYL